jgi:hypothetical protein
LEERLRHFQPAEKEAPRQDEQARLQQQLSAAKEKLRNLGACPKPMMG